MAAKKKLNTITTVDYNPSLQTVKIKAQYTESTQDSLPNTLKGQIADEAGLIGNISYKEGDLLLTIKNFPSQIKYQLDKENLILFTNTGDGGQYRISEEGDLLYDKTI